MSTLTPHPPAARPAVPARHGFEYAWQLAPRLPDALLAEAAQRFPDLHPALAQVLFARGLPSADLIADFLAGIVRDSDEPTLLADVPCAVDRLVQARQHGHRIAIFTDYDADGVNAAAVLTTGLRLVGIEPLVRLPNRFTDGYGLTPAIVEELANRGAHVIVTADCGSTAHAAADLARQRGVDLLITDHHHCQAPLPNAYAVVNPWRPDCQYPYDFLCGAGVAYKLLQALADRLLPGEGRAAMKPLLDLVAVATVADIMPLVGENRHLVLEGLAIMNAFPRPGVRALLEVAGLQPGQVDAASLGFRVAPRVNAAGRLEDPGIAYRLLMADSYADAYALAQQVNQLNQARQTLSRKIEDEATQQVRPLAQAGAYSLVCGSQAWPQGIVGLVAGRLAQTYHRPALAYTVLDGVAQGSGRSIPGFDLLAALRECDDLFTRYGGHQAAAGFTLPVQRLPDLAERFENVAAERLTPAQLERVLPLDCYLRPETITWDFVTSIERLAPFGHGFPEPTFGVRNLTVRGLSAMGADKRHLRLRLSSGSTYLDAVMWGKAHLLDHLRAGATVDAALRLRREHYNGQWRLKAEVQDLIHLT